jgi:hypothetical protein
MRSRGLAAQTAGDQLLELANCQPTPVDLAALRDPSFSDGLSPSQHLDVLCGGPDPRVQTPPPGEVEELAGFLIRLASWAFFSDSKRVKLTRAAALLQQRAAPDPVAVSDRPPTTEETP